MYVGVAVDWSASQSPLNTLNLLLLSNHSHLRRHGETKQKSLIASMFAEQPEVSLLASLHLTIYTRYSNLYALSMLVEFFVYHLTATINRNPIKKTTTTTKQSQNWQIKKNELTVRPVLDTRKSPRPHSPTSVRTKERKKKRTNIAIDLDTRLTVMNTYQKSNT